MIKFADPQFGELEAAALQEVAKQQTLTNGPKNKEFAEKFLEFVNGEKHGYECMTVSSCTAALHLSYLALGLKEGDEVIVPAMTHVSTAHAVELVGATPVFVDCDSTGNIDVVQLGQVITRRTRAISIVHFLGEPAKMDRIVEVANSYGLPVIEDCALALGSYYGGKYVGTIGDFGCFSFYPCKAITTGEGGMLVYKKEHASKLESLREFGKCYSSTHMYDICRLGLNYRMNEFAAAVGVVQLERFVKEQWGKIRIDNYDMLRTKIRNNYFEASRDCGSYISVLDNLGNYALSVLFYSSHIRDEYKKKFVEAGVQTSVYYPLPVPFFDYYKKKYGCQEVRYKNAKRISDLSITLPIGPHITEKDIDAMVDVLRVDSK